MKQKPSTSVHPQRRRGLSRAERLQLDRMLAAGRQGRPSLVAKIDAAFGKAADRA